MKLSGIISAIALSGITFMASAQQGKTMESLALGSSIPASTEVLKAVTGQETTLGRAKSNNGLLVMFSCNTCPYVVKSQKRTMEVMNYAKQHDIGMVILNSNEAQRADADSENDMLAYAKSQGYTVPYLVDKDSKMANLFGATRTPEVFLFDKTGKLVYKGAMEDNPTEPKSSKSLYVKAAIDNMVAGKPINPASTKSIGCSIKRTM